MSHHNHRSAVIFKMLFQPSHRFGIQMVGRLVKQQHVRFLQKQPTQRHPAFFAAGKFSHIGISRRTAQRIHGNFNRAFQIPTVAGIDFFLQFGLFIDKVVHFLIAHRLGKTGGNFFKFLQQVTGFTQTVHNIFHHVFIRIKFRLLFQIADLDTLGGPGLAVKFLVHPGHNL